MIDSLVFLLPRFFGFASVVALGGCAAVEPALAQALRQLGAKARTGRCNPRPTAVPRCAAAAQVACAFALEG